MTRMNRPSYTMLILDVDHVLLSWSMTTKTISSETFQPILSSAPWLEEYKCGRITQEVCYHWVSERFSLELVEVAEAFLPARIASVERRNDLSCS